MARQSSASTHDSGLTESTRRLPRQVESQQPNFEKKAKLLNRRIAPPNSPPPQKHQDGSHIAFISLSFVCLFKLTVSQRMLQHTLPLGFIVSTHSPLYTVISSHLLWLLYDIFPLSSPGRSDHSFWTSALP